MNIEINKEPESPANKHERTVTDARGRVIVVKRPSVLERANFLLALGDAASNQAYMSQFGFINWVYSIDGKKEIKPTDKTEVDGLLSRLGDEGYDAVTNAFIDILSSSFSETKEEEAPNNIKK